MQNNRELLDQISVGKKDYKGVIDYVTSKHYVFYDLTNNNDPNVPTMVMIWKSYFPHLRFSVFKSLHFPNVKVGSPYLLKKKDVTSEITNLPRTTKIKKKTTKVKRTPTTQSRD